MCVLFSSWKVNNLYENHLIDFLHELNVINISTMTDVEFTAALFKIGELFPCLFASTLVIIR